MTTNRRFSLELETLVELKQDTASSSPPPVPAAPTLSRVLSEIGSLPREALFLGVAADGLPVLLNLHDPIPGPLLVAGDAGAGKTAFLQMLAHGLQQTHRSEDVQFAVITDHPGEWENVEPTGHCVGIFPVAEAGAGECIHSLVKWAHTQPGPHPPVLLLVDDLEAIANLDSETLHNLRWLLLRGPARRVWPILTLNAERYGQVLAWLPMFRTRIFGRIGNQHIAGALGGDQASALNQLEAGVQFSLRENGQWLKFWLPSC
jgi:hypothetical protein